MDATSERVSRGSLRYFGYAGIGKEQEEGYWVTRGGIGGHGFWGVFGDSLTRTADPDSWLLCDT